MHGGIDSHNRISAGDIALTSAAGGPIVPGRITLWGLREVAECGRRTWKDGIPCRTLGFWRVSALQERAFQAPPFDQVSRIDVR